MAQRPEALVDWQVGDASFILCSASGGVRLGPMTNRVHDLSACFPTMKCPARSLEVQTAFSSWLWSTEAFKENEKDYYQEIRWRPQ